MTTTSRAARRRTLFTLGLLPSLLLLLCSARIVLLLQADAAGRDAYQAGQYADARDSFAQNRLLNAVQPWVAPLDEGDARFRMGDYAGAAAAFAAALEHAPADRQCDVRVNLALAREAEGDARLEDGDRPGAETSWKLGRAALATCTTREAAEVARRLDHKLGPRPPRAEPVEPPPPPADLEAREKELAERNQRALEQRLRNEQRTDSPRAPVPHW